MKKVSNKELMDFDREHIWHPYTSMTDPQPVQKIHSASGVMLKLEDGRELVDGMSSWWTAIHGYNHPALNEAAKNQIETMSHIMFGGLTHDPAIDLASLLVDITPSPLQKVFYSDSGSVSVEVAIKMAFQYWIASGKPDKNRLVTIRSGYHGDTFYAMSVCDPVNGMHGMFGDIIPGHFFADAPETGYRQEWDESDIESLQAILKKHHEAIAALILEPVVQGAGGMRFYSPVYLQRARELCDRFKVLLIFDEIATGFGRTGKLFASELAGVSPDILCLGKAMTGGYISFAATLCTEEVSSIISSAPPGAFMHGPTFMGNPLACAISSASIRLLLSYNYEEIISSMEKQLFDELDACTSLASVKEVRVLGGIGVVEMNEPVNIISITNRFIERGVWIRPFGRLVYIMPPYIIKPDELSMLTGAIYEAVSGEEN